MQCFAAKWCIQMQSGKKSFKRKKDEEQCRVKQGRKRGKMKEGGRRSCFISSGGERFKAWNSILGSTGQAGLVCMGAYFLCVIRRRESVCICVCAHWGLQFREVWRCFVCSGRKGMPKSNTVNRMSREKDEEKRQRARKSKRTRWGERRGETESRDPESSQQKEFTKENSRGERRTEQQIDFRSLPLKTTNSIPAAAICIPAEQPGGWAFCLQADKLSDGKPSSSLTSPWSCRACPHI